MPNRTLCVKSGLQLSLAPKQSLTGLRAPLTPRVPPKKSLLVEARFVPSTTSSNTLKHFFRTSSWTQLPQCAPHPQCGYLTTSLVFVLLCCLPIKFSSFTVPHLSLSLHINYSTMRPGLFFLWLSGTSFKLKYILPYQVSLSIVGNMHNIGKVVSRKREGGLGKERRGLGGGPEEKEEDANTPSNFAFERGIRVEPPESPSLSVLFINVWNNSLEE